MYVENTEKLEMMMMMMMRFQYLVTIDMNTFAVIYEQLTYGSG